MTFIEDENKNDFQVNNFSADNPSMDSGQGQFPQFDANAQNFGDIQQQIESAKSNGWGASLSNFLSRNKKRLLVLSAIVLLFAGGSYLSGNNEQGSSPAVGGTASIADDSSHDNDSEGKTLAVEDSESDYPVNILDINLGDDGQVMIDDSMESSMDDGTVITKTAESGDGITHLAREALDEYLASTGKTLSAEQMVYAEDYIQNKTGSEFLEIGQKLSFSIDLLSEAVEAAQQLEDWQIENLKQYTL